MRRKVNRSIARIHISPQRNAKQSRHVALRTRVDGPDASGGDDRTRPSSSDLGGGPVVAMCCGSSWVLCDKGGTFVSLCVFFTSVSRASREIRGLRARFSCRGERERERGVAAQNRNRAIRFDAASAPSRGRHRRRKPPGCVPLSRERTTDRTTKRREVHTCMCVWERVCVCVLLPRDDGGGGGGGGVNDDNDDKQEGVARSIRATLIWLFGRVPCTLRHRFSRVSTPRWRVGSSVGSTKSDGEKRIDIERKREIDSAAARATRPWDRESERNT